MKENNKQVVFYSTEKNGFLESYKDRSTLAFEAKFSDDLDDALYVPVESYEKQKTNSTSLLNCLAANAQENRKLKKELWNLKKSKGKKWL